MHNNENRYSVLSSIKGLLILVIVLFHAKGFFPIEYIPGVRYLVEHAHDYANYFFFAISGFLISVGYKERISEEKVDFLHFMWKRIRKIYPVYLITNSIVFIITIAQNSFIETANLLYLVRVALMMSYGWFGNVQPFNYPTWFICILMQCYMIYYFVAKQKKKNPDMYCLLLFLIPVSGYWLMNNDFHIPFISKDNGEAYLSFFVGVIMSEIICAIESLNSDRRQLLTRRIVVMCFAFLTVCCAGTYIYSFKVFTGNAVAVNSILVCPAVFFISFYFTPFRQLLNLKPFKIVGDISMSLYFWHAPLLFLFKLIRDNWKWLQSVPSGIQFSLFLVCLFAFCSFYHYYIEKRVFS